MATTKTTTIDLSAGGHLGISIEKKKGVLGALVVNVHPSDLAAKAGLKAGHVITALNGEEVKDGKSAFKIFESEKKRLVVEYASSIAESPKKPKRLSFRKTASFAQKPASVQADILADVNKAVEEAQAEVEQATEVMEAAVAEKELADKAAAAAEAEAAAAAEQQAAAQKIQEAANASKDRKEKAKAAEEVKAAQKATAEAEKIAEQKKADAEAAAEAAQVAAAVVEKVVVVQEEAKAAATEVIQEIRTSELKRSASEALPYLLALLLVGVSYAVYFMYMQEEPEPPPPPPPKGFAALVQKLLKK